MKASDNDFSSLLLVEQTDPPVVAVGQRRLYAKADHKLYHVDNSGVEVEVGAGGSGGDSSGFMSTIIPEFSDPTMVGTWVAVDFDDVGVHQGNAFYNSSNAQDDSLSWDIFLPAGIYSLVMYARRSTNTGIVTLNLNTIAKGTADTYGTVVFEKILIENWTVPSSGKQTIQLKMATKNASSSGYCFNLYALTIQRIS